MSLQKTAIFADRLGKDGSVYGCIYLVKVDRRLPELVTEKVETSHTDLNGAVLTMRSSYAEAIIFDSCVDSCMLVAVIVHVDIGRLMISSKRCVAL